MRQAALSLDGTVEDSSYGTPAFKLNGKMFARLHQDGENIVLRTHKKVRAGMISGNPNAFHVTEHYVGSPYVLARLVHVTHGELEEALLDALRRVGGGES
ncbi:hypothetical protein BH11PLA2_BH11PLA2_49200 [soil metagenome]